MFSRILHANDGSEHAFHALTVALAIAKQNDSVSTWFRSKRSTTCRSSLKR